MRQRPALFSIALTGAGLIAATLIIALVDAPQAHRAIDIAAYGAMLFCGMGGAALLWQRSDRSAVSLLLAVALLARLLLFFKTPFLSADAYRYLFDGHLLLHGLNPYVIAPDSSAAAPLHADWLYHHIYWHQFPSLYPPLALGLFAFADWIGHHSLLAIKTLVELGDCGVIALLLVALHRRSLPLGRAALYAWSPLTIIEFSWSAHEDAWCAVALVAAVLFFDGGRRVVAGLALAGAVLVKLYPIAFVPVFFSRRAGAAVAVCLASVGAGYAPFYAWNPNVFGFLHDWVLRYQHNDTLFLWVGQGGAAACFAAAVIAAFFARLRGAPLAETLVLVMLAYLLLSPTVWPWYLSVFLVLVPLVPHAFENSMRPLAAGIVGWVALAPLGYAAHAIPLALVIEYAPLAIGLVFYLRNVIAQRVLAFEPAA